eukprot:4310134-Pleurochrysis_carterae.AAC.2
MACLYQSERQPSFIMRKHHAGKRGAGSHRSSWSVPARCPSSKVFVRAEASRAALRPSVPVLSSTCSVSPARTRRGSTTHARCGSKSVPPA